MSPVERPDEHNDDERGWRRVGQGWRRGGAVAQSGHARTVARRSTWRAIEMSAFAVVAPSVRARFAGSRAERVGARRGGNVCDVITCSGFAHPRHARRGPTICEMYIDDRSSAIYINVRYDVGTNVRLHASGYPSTLQLSLRTSSSRVAPVRSRTDEITMGKKRI
jgi:hypothetical protein